ncbi:MAG: LuxR C-terminal-related transcriptional regulator [Agriterribacter sp.]
MHPKPGNVDELLKNLRVLNQIGASILSEQSTEQIIETVYHYVNQLIDAYSFAIGVYNKITGFFEYTGARENDKVMPPFSIYAHSDERFSGWVFAHKKDILINDFESEYQLYLPKTIKALQGLEPASLMYVPILLNQEIIGILSVRTPIRNAYSAQSLEVLKTMAVFIGKAIENAGITGKRTLKPLPANYTLNPLSARELEVLDLLSKGFTNKDIAATLFISASTVKTHTLNIYQKFEAENRTQAIVKAKEFGVIS